ncbi:hypothetical protein SteCoe_6219 [Stentor coeruleus]|uniref:Rab-GAP TBC domain-containing protein n=1 Tax=Stentor coeruleus TaxID=5963 RepID=A0A1R2CQI7_9CILI|nr:hypothetical protein SteCoe_6219 [Stentor coeruleus]
MSSNIELSLYNPTSLKSEHFPQCQCNKSYSGPKCLSLTPIKPECCKKAKKWVKRSKFPQDPKSTYQKLVTMASNESNNNQVALDASRTYSQVEYFTSGPGKYAMMRLISAFCVYSPVLGYVQGMNYIVAALLWHATEVEAFWLFVVLVEDFELRDNFLPGFPGLKKHAHVVDFLINSHIPRLYTHFLNLSVSVELFATDWFLTLFSKNVPIQLSGYVLKHFFRQGWVFFYKLCLEILIRLCDKLLIMRTFAETLLYLKPQDHSPRQWKVFMKNLEKGRDKGDWEKIVKSASIQDIDENFLYSLYHNTLNHINFL